jgi:hypothetical protein
MLNTKFLINLLYLWLHTENQMQKYDDFNSFFFSLLTVETFKKDFIS